LLTDPAASPDMQGRVKIVMEAIASAEVGGGTSPTAAATPPAAADGAAKAEPPKTEAKPAAESTSEPDKKP
jgi:hypothetical protein